MAVYFAIFQILPIFVYELFETMQSSVTRSKTSITKSLPASFKLSIFVLYSESYNKIHCFSVRNYRLQGRSRPVSTGVINKIAYLPVVNTIQAMKLHL